MLSSPSILIFPLIVPQSASRYKGVKIFFDGLYKIPMAGKTSIDISNWKGGFAHVKEQEKPSTRQHKTPTGTGTNARAAKKAAASWADEQ